MQDDVYRARSDKSQFVSLNTPVVYNSYAPIRWIVRNEVVEVSTCFPSSIGVVTVQDRLEEFQMR